MGKNYYIILGISPEASQKEVKQAYRDKVKRFHPDHYGEDREPFLDLQEAYAVLGNPARRRDYDRLLNKPAGKKSPEQPRYSSSSPQAEPLIPDRNSGELFLDRSFDANNPSFEEIFDRIWHNFDRGFRPWGERPRSLNIEIVLSPLEAVRGGEVVLNIPVRSTCPICRGKAEIAHVDCLRCNSLGFIKEDIPLKIEYPPGITSDYSLSVPLTDLNISNTYLIIDFRVPSGEEW